MADNPRPQDLESIIKELKGSPVFKLSLSSKELFHSNFIAWLCESYPAQIGAWFAEFLSRMPQAGAPVKVYREWKHLDLVLEYGAGQLLVIENKVKSLPDRRQLERYTESMKDQSDVCFLLLSLSRPYFLDASDRQITLAKGASWQYLSYLELAVELEKRLPCISAANNYHGLILMDYIRLVRNLHALIEIFRVGHTDEHSDFFGSQRERQRLKEIRLYDLIDKLRYAQLAQSVIERLEQNGCEVIRDNWESGRPNQILVDSGMTRGEGLFDLKYVIRERGNLGSSCVLGIQLQRDAFKLYFELLDNSRAIKIADSLLRGSKGKRLWFDFTLVPFKAQEYPGNGGFNQYGGTFLYRYKKLRSISPKGLVDLVAQYVRTIEKNISFIFEEVDRAIDLPH